MEKLSLEQLRYFALIYIANAPKKRPVQPPLKDIGIKLLALLRRKWGT